MVVVVHCSCIIEAWLHCQAEYKLLAGRLLCLDVKIGRVARIDVQSGLNVNNATRKLWIHYLHPSTSRIVVATECSRVPHF